MRPTKQFLRVSRLGMLLLGACSSVAVASPVTESWASESVSPTTAVAAAQLSGWYATADTSSDTIEIRDIRQTLIHQIARSDIQELAPWMTLDSSDDGPRAIAWTDSGRSLFIVVTDNTASPDGLGSDVVLRYDTTTKELTRFARADIGEGTGDAPACMHYKGKLWVSTQTGGVRVYSAGRNNTSGSLNYEWFLPENEAVRGMCIARPLDTAFVVTETTLYRVDFTQPFAITDAVGSVTRGRGVAYSDHFGQPWHEGVYVIEGAGNGMDAQVLQVPKFQATGLLPYSPALYVQSSDDLVDITSTACGRFLLASGVGPRMLAESEDTRLDYETWLRDEFDQVVTFAEGLVSPDGEPAGWVIDADVNAGSTRFHPPTPDGAAWVVMLQIAKDFIAGDQGSKDLVRSILQRYAGLMPDGIVPQLTSDGIMRHWYDPLTGNVKPGWSTEYATLSTMLLTMSADRARRFYSNDATIVESADEVIHRIQGWGSYIQPGSNALYLRASASGGPDFGTAGGPFYEGVIFVEQASVYGSSDAAYAFWLDRSALPQSEYVVGLPVTSNWPGNHLPAFVSLYPWIAQSAFRSDPAWEAHIRNQLASFGAWTDDNAPSFMTVFSAGTTRSDWGGYHADSLSDHPGDVTTFPSLMAFSSLGDTAPSVGAYHAYRHGARQEFATGASILFRKSNIDPSYVTPDAGLPDVVIGALGLAELIQPGTANAVLATAYQPPCPADFAAPAGALNFLDISAFLGAFNARDSAADIASPFGQFNFLDISAFLQVYSLGCP
tara:strand:- start:521321 stop:523657 length:2337 start_codon:yes stop_codon:yes gene_type:complete